MLVITISVDTCCGGWYGGVAHYHSLVGDFGVGGNRFPIEIQTEDEGRRWRAAAFRFWGEIKLQVSLRVAWRAPQLPLRRFATFYLPSVHPTALSKAICTRNPTKFPSGGWFPPL